MRIAITDDDKEQRAALAELLCNELARVGSVTHRITEYPSGEALLAEFERGSFDLILLDIYMGETNGVQTAYRIREKDDEVLLVFCTSSNEFASESFDVGARYYLRKPINAEGIAAMLKRLNLDDIEKNRAVTLPGGKAVRGRAVLYTEVCEHAVTVALNDGRLLRVRTSHTEIERLLSPLGYFFSPSKGIVINLYEVARMEEDAFVMSNGTSLPIVRRKKKEAREVFDAFRFQKLKKEQEK